MFGLRSLLKRLGPGFITGASDDDPSGIATYTQSAARFGYAQLWTAAWSLPFMIAIQEMTARLGMVTGQGLAATIRKRYPAWVLWLVVVLVFTANTVNIGANLGAMADATALLLPGAPVAVYAVGYAIVILLLEIFITYKTYANVLKWFALSLFSYVVTAAVVTVDWSVVVFHAVVPTFVLERDFILMLVAILGTTISPYLFLWQSSTEVEEEIAEGRTTLVRRRGASTKEIREMRADVAGGMTFSNLIMFFIMTTAAMAFFGNGLHDIGSSAEAARVLEPFAGRFASLVFAIGIIGTGLLAVPVLSASASYALSDALGWSGGLYKKLRQAHGFYGAITIATLVGLLMTFFGVNPIRALILAAALNGLVAPVLIFIILRLANDGRVMGRWTNGPLSNVLCWGTFAVMTVSAVLLFVLP